MNNYIIMALIATVGTWFVTALGAATVVFFKTPNKKALNIMLGFASGVMIAASFWSLLQPAIERAESMLDTPAFVTFARAKANNQKFQPNEKLQRIIMLVLSITLHNIPEGLAVGVAFGALQNNFSTENLLCAISVAVGIGLQNFPEGAAVSVPLRREGYSRKKSFLLGQASGMVEPIAGLIGAMATVYVESILPYALSFAAGAMLLVAVHELIPECQKNQKSQSYFSTMGIVSGFAVMMLLDVMLG